MSGQPLNGCWGSSVLAHFIAWGLLHNLYHRAGQLPCAGTEPTIIPCPLATALLAQPLITKPTLRLTGCSHHAVQSRVRRALRPRIVSVISSNGTSTDVTDTVVTDTPNTVLSSTSQVICNAPVIVPFSLVPFGRHPA
eukprot:1195206-Prorocentrum_minimum.AAC.1